MQEYNEVIDAIEQSTKKWIKISHNMKHDKGANDCALCNLFIEDSCNECPISSSTTTKNACHGTPVEKWFRHQSTYHNHRYWENEYRVNDCDICKQIALEEALFIYSLL